MSYILVYIPEDSPAPMADVHEALSSVGVVIEPYKTRNLSWIFEGFHRDVKRLQEMLPNILATLSEPPTPWHIRVGGMASTRELLEEIKARGELECMYREEGDAMAIGAANLMDMLPGSMLDYRTVDA